MPFGISESAIKGAYGAMDLSGVYKTLQAGIDKLAKQEKEYKQQAIKDYGQEYNKLSEAIKGIKGADATDLTDKFNKWKSLAMKKANDSSFYNDTGKAMKIEGELSSLFTDVLNHSLESKDKAKTHLNIWNDMKVHRDDYATDAMERFQKEVIDRPTSYITANNSDDLSKYTNPIPHYEKEIVDKIEKVSNNSVVKDFRPIIKIKGWVGKQDEYKDIPVYHDMLDGIHKVLASKDDNYRLGASTKMLKNYVDSDGKVNDNGKYIIDKFNEILNKQKTPKSQDIRGSGLDTNISDNYFFKDEDSFYKKVSSNKASAAATIAAMDNYVNKYNKVTYIQGVPKSIDPMAEKEAVANLNLTEREQYYNYTHPELSAFQKIDINKALLPLAGSLETDPETNKYKKDLVERYNIAGFMPSDMKFLTPAKKTANANPNIYSYIADFKELKDDVKFQGYHNNKEWADHLKDLNDNNAYRGLEITSESITNSRIIAFPVEKSDKTVVNVWVDPATESGRNFITRETNKRIKTKKEEAGIFSGIGQEYSAPSAPIKTKKAKASTKFGGTPR